MKFLPLILLFFLSTTAHAEEAVSFNYYTTDKGTQYNLGYKLQDKNGNFSFETGNYQTRYLGEYNKYNKNLTLGLYTDYWRLNGKKVKDDLDFMANYRLNRWFMQVNEYSNTSFKHEESELGLGYSIPISSNCSLDIGSSIKFRATNDFFYTAGLKFDTNMGDLMVSGKSNFWQKDTRIGNGNMEMLLPIGNNFRIVWRGDLNYMPANKSFSFNHSAKIAWKIKK